MRVLRILMTMGLVCVCGVPVAAQKLSLQGFETARPERQMKVLADLQQGDPVTISEVYGGPGFGPITGDDQPDPEADQALRIIGAYPLPGMGIGEEIILFFSEDILPLPDAGTPRAPVVLEPDVDGYTEIKGNCLRFTSPYLSALSKNPAVKEIKVTLHPELRSVSGKRMRKEERQRVFVNAALSIKNLRYVGTASDHAELAVDFSYPVDKSQLGGILMLRDAKGEPVDFTIMEKEGEGPNRVVLQLPVTTVFPVNVTLGYGLRWNAPEPLVSGPLQAKFPSEEMLQISDKRYAYDTKGYLYLKFSEPVQTETLLGLLEVKRADNKTPLKLTLARASNTEYRFEVLLEENEELPPRIVMRLPSILSSADGRKVLGEETTETLPLQGYRRRNKAGGGNSSSDVEELGVRHHYWSDENIDGYELRISFTEMVTAEDLYEHIRIAPPVNNLSVDVGSYGSQMTIKGDWESEKDYVLHLTAGLESSDQTARLSSNAAITLDETPFATGAQFDSPGLYYFLRKEASSPRIKARNITEAKVKLARIFPSNLPVFVREYIQYEENSELPDLFAEELGAVDIKFPDTRDKTFTKPIDLSALMPGDKRGVFIMGVDPVYGWDNAQRILVYTDMGALTHWNDSELAVFVHDLFTLEPIDQAQVTVFSNKFQPMGNVNTGSDGIAKFSNFNKILGAPALVVIEKGEDYTFLDLREKVENKTPFTPDMPLFDSEGYDAYLYLDRNLYRPGEPVHIRWIARTHYVDALAGVPLHLRIANPQGRWIYETAVTLSEFGTGGCDFQSERIHPTGKYTVELRVPEAAQPVGVVSFNLEEFVPNRLRATTAFNVERLAPGDTAVLSVVAENLFGGVAVGRKTEGRVFLKPMRYESKNWPGYSFGNEDQLEESLYSLGESVTDANGKSSFEYVFEPAEDATMPLKVVASGRVLELGGRAVSDAAEAVAFPDKIMLGVSAAPRPEKEMLDVHVLALNADETPAALDSVKVTLERRQWNYYLRRLNDRNDPRWEEVYSPVKTFDVPLQEGKGTLELPYPNYGEYRLRVHHDQTRMYSSVLFNRWWGKLSVEAASRPELIRLTMNQETYHQGDQLELRIESPYDGTAYIVAQGDRIEDVRTVAISGGEGKTTFTVPQTWFPNVWLQVSVVRNAQNRDVSHYPYSSFAMINVPLDDPDRRIETAFLDLPERVRPAQPLEVVLETKDQGGNPVAAEITVAAVDEGIHTILGYENPDPYTYFQRSRKLEVCQAHYYDKVFYDPGDSPEGGDMMRRLGLTSKVDENWIRPVALWSGVVRSDETGRATVTFNVPEFIGQLRLVAVAVTARASGVAAAPVIVRRPYVLRTSMPRFALAGDQFECTVVPMNLSEAQVKAVVRWNASGTLAGAGEQALELAAGAENAFRVPVTAASAPGQGMIEWTMTVTDASGAALDTITEKAPLPVRPPVAYQTDTSFITVKPGETRVLENTAFYVDPGLHTSVEVSGDLFLQARPALKYLLQYPYGCVEQTVSRAMPLYFLRNYARLYEDMFIGDMEAARVASRADGYIVSAVERLLSMQTVDGGIGFWPGLVESYPYGSIYALHFLTLVRRDHTVPVYETAFKNLQLYAAEIMKNDRVSTSGNYYLRAYACYVLALDGNLEAVEFASRFDTVEVPRSARYLLGAARAMHSSTPESLLNYLDTAPMSEDGAREYGGNLHSSVRAEAVQLIALLQMNAPEARWRPLVDSLVTYLADRKNYTTQDTAFAVTALSLFLEKQEADTSTTSIRVTDTDGERKIGPGEVFSKTVEGVAPRFEIVNEGAAPAYVYLEMAGNPLSPRLTPEEKGIVISREFKRENGMPVDGMAFKHGEQYLVDLTIIPRKDMENLLVTDLLPAGFEIANPRLEADKQPQTESEGDEEQAEDASMNLIITPDFLEVRDDRLAFAMNHIGAQMYKFRYLVRAVTPGRFQLPALHAECMYAPDLHATTLPSEISIE